MNIYFRKIVNKNWIQSSDFSHYEFRRSLTSFFRWASHLCLRYYFFLHHLPPANPTTCFGCISLGGQSFGRLGWEDNWEVGDIRLYFHHMFWSYKDNQCSGRGIYRIKIWDYSHSESGRSLWLQFFRRAKIGRLD